MDQVVAHYRTALLNDADTLARLHKLGITGEAVDHFELGLADRSLVLRLPSHRLRAGVDARSRLQRMGILRDNGHEHLRGSVVVPIRDREGRIVQLYGRKLGRGLRPGTELDLYLPGERRGCWNLPHLDLAHEVVIYREPLQALKAWSAGERNVTTSLHLDQPAPDLREALCACRSSMSDGLVAAPPPLPPMVQMPVPPPAEPRPTEEISGELVLNLGDRRYRIRGLDKNTSLHRLVVNVLVTREGLEGAFHVDTLDLLLARQRSAFIKQASIELGAEADVVKRDLGRVLLEVEEKVREPLHRLLRPEPQLPPMTAAEQEAALGLLRDPKLLDRLLADYNRCGVVGEETNKLLSYLAGVSRKLDEPLAVLIQSSTAAGKSSLMEAALAFVPPEDKLAFSALTGQSLFYLGEDAIKHKVLAIAEDEGADRAAYALKLLQSEQRLTIASTGKEAASGRLVSEVYRVEGPVALFLSTTRIDVDEELPNRCITLTVTEGREQTRAIHRLQRERQTLQGIIAQQERTAVLHLHHNAQRLLRPFLVVNLHAPDLTYKDERTRSRRDHRKYLNLIRAAALLHQCQREVRSTTINGVAVEYIEATLEDVAIADRLMASILDNGVDHLPPHTPRLLVLLNQMVEEESKSRGISRSEYRFSRRQVRDVTGYGNTQLKHHLRRLVDLELVIPHHHGPSVRYELAYGAGGARHTRPAGDWSALGRGASKGTSAKGNEAIHEIGAVAPDSTSDDQRNGHHASGAGGG